MKGYFDLRFLVDPNPNPYYEAGVDPDFDGSFSIEDEAEVIKYRRYLYSLWA